jgi:Xaa-Pro aminopeptidase
MVYANHAGLSQEEHKIKESMIFGKRRARAAAELRRLNLSSLLVTEPANIRYLSGFTGSNGALVLLAGRTGVRARLFTDGRYTAQAKAEAAGVSVTIAKRSVLAEACVWLVQQKGVESCGFDPATVTVATLEGMKKAVPAARRRSFFRAAPGVVPRLRELKDAYEIGAMREAAALGCQLYEHLLTVIEAGMTEQALAATLEYAARMAGAEAMSFETIVASGERSALPHGRATQAKLPRRGLVTLDFGVILNGYCSDMTRTVYLGSAASAEERRVFDAVLAAQMTAVEAVKPGVTAGDVDEAARSILRSAGLEKAFSHSTGHGVGLEIHEGPRVGAGQKQLLEPGMIITIEPGAYLPGRFGVRIEDMVLVTNNGAEILTPSPKAWTQL